MHYIYTIEGIMEALQLNSRNQVERRKKAAIKEGYLPSKIICGIEYFDYGQLEKEGKPLKKEEFKTMINKSNHVQLLLF